MNLAKLFTALACSLAAAGVTFSPESQVAERECSRLGHTAPELSAMSEVTPEQQALLGSPEFRHAVSVAARAALVRRAAARGDVLAWGQAAMPDKFNLPFCRGLHQYLVDVRGAETSAVKAPRGFAKTVIGCTLIPMYQGLQEPKTFNFYLNVQANDEKALAVNRSIKQEVEENEVLRAAYGYQVSNRWTDGEFELRNGVVFKSVGAGVSIRGMQYRNRRPDYVMVDDVYDEADIYSLEATERVNSWLKGTLYKVMARARRSSFHVRGTAINRADILTEMAASWPGCVSRTFAAIREDGSSLWPELYTLAELEEDRQRMGTIIYNRELMNACADESECIVKDSWLKDWEFDPATRFAKMDRDFHVDTVLLGCDPSTGEKETGDPAGFAVVVKTKGPGTRYDYWVVALHNEVMSWDARLAQLERMQSMQNARGLDFRVRRAFVEGIGGFKDFGNQAKAKTSLPVEVVSWVKGKKANLAAKSGDFEFGRVHVSRDVDPKLRNLLRDQLTQNEPKHDDLRDAVLLCLEDKTLSMKSWVTG